MGVLAILGLGVICWIINSRLLDSRCRRPDEDHPARGRTWDRNRQIRAQVLRQLLTGEGCLDQTFGRPMAVRLRGASVSGRLNLGGLPVRCPLELYGCYLGGRLDLAKAEASDISLRGSHLARRLSACRLRLTNNLNLTGGFRCHARVDLREGQIGGSLNCEGATLSNPGGRALNAAGVTVDGFLSLADAEVTGEVRLISARVGANLVCGKTTLSNPDARALDLADSSVTEAVAMHPARLDGSINLIAARVGGWYDDRCTWPKRTALRLEGFVYDAIDAEGVTPKQRLGWLRRQEGYLPQPYEQLASVYRQAGHDQAARTVAVAKQQARRAQARRWWVRAPSRAWSFVLRWTIGYGYRPALVLPYPAGLFVVGWVVFHHAYPTELSPAKSGPEQPEFNPARYTLDLLAQPGHGEGR